MIDGRADFDASARAGIWLSLLMVMQFAFASFSLSFADERLVTSREFDALPTPLKAYVLSIGVQSGVKDPANITLEPSANFRIPVTNSDLNDDGREDYFVSDCLFFPLTDRMAYQTNGYACFSGALIISHRQGYTTTETSGILVSADRMDKKIVLKNAGAGYCDGQKYSCNVTFKLDFDGLSYSLKPTHFEDTSAFDGQTAIEKSQRDVQLPENGPPVLRRPKSGEDLLRELFLEKEVGAGGDGSQ